MFYNENSYYFSSIRKITGCFGSLFTNIVINRFELSGGIGNIIKTIKVPFSYGSSQKWIRILEESRRKDPLIKIRTFLPRISFELIAMDYDPTRKLPTLNQVNKILNDSHDINAFKQQMVPVPYNFTFQLYITTKSLDDGMQILEQILPHFTPSYNVTVNYIPELGISQDVPIRFISISSSDEYTGSLEDFRVIGWTLTFELQGHLYPAIKNGTLIKEVIARIHDEGKQGMPIVATVDVSIDPMDAVFNDAEDWTAKTVIT